MDVAAAAAAALVVGAYLLGTFPTAIVVAGRQVLNQGSGNPGASNVYRLKGRKAAAAVFAGDTLKGAIATATGAAINGHHSPLALAMGAAAVLGHCLPITRRLHGGKGVATAAGMAVVLEPFIGLAAAAVWVVTAKATRKASLASLVTTTTATAAVLLLRGANAEALTLTAVALFVIARHWRNITRLIKGQESSLPANPG